MLIDMLVVAVVFQKSDSVLNDNGGDQTIDVVSNRTALLSELPINAGSQLEGGAIIFEINEPFEQPFHGGKFLVIPDSLQHLR